LLGRLDQADTYADYIRMLDTLERSLEAVERGGEVRCGGQSATDVYG